MPFIICQVQTTSGRWEELGCRTSLADVKEQFPFHSLEVVAVVVAVDIVAVVAGVVVVPVVIAADVVVVADIEVDPRSADMDALRLTGVVERFLPQLVNIFL